MEQRRFLLFIVLSVTVMLGYSALRSRFAPPPPKARQAAQKPHAGQAPEKAAAEKPKELAGKPGAPHTQDEVKRAADEALVAEDKGEQAQKKEEPPIEPAAPAAPPQLVALGSLNPETDNLLVMLNSRGAAVERIELSSYRDLDDESGYLGHLALTDEPNGGCRVRVVGAGTPAAEAKPARDGIAPGLQVDDVIREVNGRPILNEAAFRRHLAKQTKPKDTILLTVERLVAGKATRIEFAAVLTEPPLQVISPQPNGAADWRHRDPLSCLLTLQTASGEGGAGSGGVLDALLNDDWQTEVIEEGRVVEFRYVLNSSQLEAINQSGALEIVKRYRLPALPTTGAGPGARNPYHLELTLEINNRDAEHELDVVYQLGGPNGLPLEGWWYSRKSRDVIWSEPGQKHHLLACGKVYKNAMKKMKKRNRGESPTTTLLDVSEPTELQYVGVDTQYFAAALKPAQGDEAKFVFQEANALPLGNFAERDAKDSGTTNVSVQLVSQRIPIAAGESFQQQFVLFAGPKDPMVLQQYGLERVIAYGWFGSVAKPLSWLLHVFYHWVGYYGIAIIMLTVLVRGCMFPISRKAAKNAQMMQQLAPEMKKIAEKYKSDAEKRMQAQRELYRKHNFNPFGGCLLMFLQLPIFIGLYRSLWVDINLRGAPLIPGLQWCSNLAAPDMFLRWSEWMPAFLAGESAWLGPYLNILPIITIVLFLVQQKMFTPPATDEQTRMQQNMMKYMMIFIGVMFFKVASGLCIYFIASSVWGIAERQLLPKSPKAKAPQPEITKTAPARAAAKSGSNGSSRKVKTRKKQKRR